MRLRSGFLALLLIVGSLLGNSSVNATNTNWTFVGNSLQGFSFAQGNGFTQSITPLNVPNSNTRVEWELTAGEQALRMQFKLSNEGFASFGFWSVNPDVRFTQTGSTSCFTATPNFYNEAGTFHAMCKTPISIQANTKYSFRLIPNYSGSTPEWNAKLKIDNANAEVDLGTIRFEVSSSQIGLNSNAGGHNQTSLYMAATDCKNNLRANAIYSKPENIGVGQKAIAVSRFTVSDWYTCPGYGASTQNDGNILHNIGNLINPGNSSNPNPTRPPSPTPSPDQSEQQKPTKPSFSLISFVGNKVEINVDLGKDAKINNVFLFAPDLTGTAGDKIPGIINGNQARWSLPIATLLSGKIIPISIIKNSDGRDSDPLMTELQMPILKETSATSRPSTPTSVKANLLGSDLLVSALVEISGKAVPRDAFLYSPSLGISKKRPLLGDIIGTKAVFSAPMKKSLIGRNIQFFIYTKNDVGKSDEARGSFQVPRVATPKVPTITTTQQTVTCQKGNSLRIFRSASCPPGWKTK